MKKYVDLKENPLFVLTCRNKYASILRENQYEEVDQANVVLEMIEV